MSPLSTPQKEAVSTRSVAEAIGRRLGLPVISVDPRTPGNTAAFAGGFFASTMTASSDTTWRLPSWKPTGPSLITDIGTGVDWA